MSTSYSDGTISYNGYSLSIPSRSGTIATIGGYPEENVVRRIRIYNSTGPSSETCSIGDMVMYFSKSSKPTSSFSSSGSWSGFTYFDMSQGESMGLYFSGKTSYSWESSSPQNATFGLAIRTN